MTLLVVAPVHRPLTELFSPGAKRVLLHTSGALARGAPRRGLAIRVGGWLRWRGTPCGRLIPCHLVPLERSRVESPLRPVSNQTPSSQRPLRRLPMTKGHP